MLPIKSLASISLIIIALFFPLKSHAAKWEFVAPGGSVKSGNYTEVFVDIESVKLISFKVYSSWVKIDHSKDKTEKANFRMQKWDIDCDKSQQRIRAVAVYNSSGSVLGSASWSEYESKWDPIIPDSLGKALQNAVCP